MQKIKNFFRRDNSIKKVELKDIENINVFLTYFPEFGETNASMSINSDNLLTLETSKMSEDALLCPFPKFQIEKVLKDDYVFSGVSFENEFLEDDKEFKIDQNPFNYYKLGILVLKKLFENNFIDISKFKIVAKEGQFTCDYCGTSYSFIYSVYYNSVKLFETKHNGRFEENNCPFLYNIIKNENEESSLNKNIISQLLFEALKVKYLDKIKFNIKEAGKFDDGLFNYMDFTNFSDLSRISPDDCCVGYGKDSLYRKSISIYKYFENYDRSEMIQPISHKYVKIIFKNNSLEFYDLSNQFGVLDFKKNHLRLNMINNITCILAKKFNLQMDHKVYGEIIN